ncbi:16853_t:CDS:2, partial [Gigaspora margarita]
QTVLEISNKNFYTQVLEDNEKHEHQPGWDDPYILEQSLTADEIGAGVGYTAMFTKHVIYIQYIDLDGSQLKAAGCHDIMLLIEYKSKVQFWSCSLNALQDQHTFTQLHSQGLLTLTPNDTSNKL